MDSVKFDVKNFMRNMPIELIENTKFYIENASGESIIEFIVLCGENKVLVEKTSIEVGAKFEDLGFGYGILSIASKDFMNIEKIQGIQYVELPKVFTTNDIENNVASCIPPVWSNYGLTGKGVLIGFIDTGIDFTHPVFSDENKKTRIKYIYNLADGTVYNEQEINKALAAENPSSIIPTVDFVGHGTAVASVAAGGGRVPKENYGVAYEASIIMVKTTGEGDFKSALSTEVLRGLKFLIDKSNELNMPLVVNISLSTNDGAHNGRSLIERYIYEYAQIQKVTVVVAAGNEGSTGHHYSALIKDEDDIFINIGGGETNISFQMYKPILTAISIELIAPDGKSTGVIKANFGVSRKETDNHRFVVYYSGPKPFDRGGEISINIKPKKGEIQFGQWILKLYNTSAYSGVFDIWLPVAEALNPKTKFLKPDPFNTLGIPATVESVISVGSYNSSANNYSYFSGRGIERVGRLVKPTLLAPGENINAAMVGGFFGPETGTSVAAPQVSGACALLIEWGIIKGNDPYLFSEKIKYYLIKGANRNRLMDIYPSKTFGFGYLCLNESLNIASLDKIDIDNSAKEFNKSQEGKSLVRKKVKVKDSNIDKRPIAKNTSQVDGKTTENNANTEIIGLPKILVNYEKKLENNNSQYKSDFLMQSTIRQYYLQPGFTDFLVQYDGNLIAAIQKINDFASAFTIDDSYAIISAKSDRIDEVINLKQVTYVDSGGVYTLSRLSPADASKAMSFEYNPYFNLTGKGTIIGIIDTGIDFLNNEFIRADNTTNIFRIWDHTLAQSTQTGSKMGIGIEYTELDINKALDLKANGKDPYSVVESKDNNGHGTAIAGLIAGRGNNNSIKGIATDTKIVMVKIKPADDEFKKLYASNKAGRYQFRNVDIMLGIKYLFDVAKSTNMPTVIYIPLGTTVGGHDGTSVIERYIFNLSNSSDILFVTSTGNEGAGENHTSGKISKAGERSVVELEIGIDQTELFMTIYCKAPDKMGLSVASPSGDVVENINPKLKSGVDINFVYESTTMNIMFIEPSELTGDQVIVVNAKGLKPGIWTFTLIGEYIVNGTYDFWLLQRELLDPNTKFLMPTPYTTLTIPSSGYNIIPVGTYNQDNESFLVDSGRGPTRDKRQCPLIVAGGYNAQVAAPGNKKSVMTGGSIAGAVVAGCCCQLLQWGIVDGNDEAMYSTKVRTYLMRATRQRKGDDYPNSQFGYGIIDMNVLFLNLKGSSVGNSKKDTTIKTTQRNIQEDTEMKEFYHNGLYVRMPKNNHS